MNQDCAGAVRLWFWWHNAAGCRCAGAAGVYGNKADFSKFAGNLFLVIIHVHRMHMFMSCIIYKYLADYWLWSTLQKRLRLLSHNPITSSARDSAGAVEASVVTSVTSVKIGTIQRRLAWYDQYKIYIHVSHAFETLLLIFWALAPCIFAKSSSNVIKLPIWSPDNSYIPSSQYAPK